MPGTAAIASTGGLRQRIAGVGIGAMAIARTSTSACAGSPSTFRNTSPTRSVARWLWATTTSTSSIPAILAGMAADVAGLCGANGLGRWSLSADRVIARLTVDPPRRSHAARRDRVV